MNVVAGISRPLWGRLADRGGGTRRTRTLRETGIVGAVAAVVILPALHAGVVPGLAATAVLAFGVFGFNGILYLIVGELAGSARSGVAVGVASTVDLRRRRAGRARRRARGRAPRLRGAVGDRGRLGRGRRGDRVALPAESRRPAGHPWPASSAPAPGSSGALDRRPCAAGKIRSPRRYRGMTQSVQATSRTR